MARILSELYLFPALIFCVAFLYSSVGHGGASGYLAIMSLFAFMPVEMSTTALILNVLVSLISFISYKGAGHFKWRLLYPFLIFSVPMVWIGAHIHVPDSIYSLLLAGVLLFAAFRLNFKIGPEITTQNEKLANFPLALLAGGSIGFVSGVVGIGGGIFLSSFLLLLGWSTIKEASAVAAPFILVNSVVGLIPRLANQALPWDVMGINALWAVAGGLLGSHLGANHFTSRVLQKLLGMVLVLAAAKLLLRY